MAKPIPFIKYNPVLIDKQDLYETYVERDGLIPSMLKKIKEQTSSKSLQHYVLIGPRGIGKTNALAMILHKLKDDASLSKKWLPVLFAEEEYFIYNLRDFFLKLVIEVHQAEGIENEQLVSEIKSDEEGGLELAVETLKRYCAKNKKRILALVDNVDNIIGSALLDDIATKRFRNILMNENFLLIIGTSTTVFKELVHYDKPFYQFFSAIYLRNLNDDEIKELIFKYISQAEDEQLTKKVEEAKDKIKAIIELTGGNPRLVLMLCEILAENPLTEVVNALNRLLDELTPYFKARLDSLTPQQRKLVDTMMRMDKAVTATEVAKELHWKQNLVTSQFSRLRELGFIKTTNGRRRKTARYFFSDKFFSLYYRMRCISQMRRKLEYLVRFIRIWYSQKELLLEIQKFEQDYEAILEAVDFGLALDYAERISLFSEALQDARIKLEVKRRNLERYLEMFAPDLALDELKGFIAVHEEHNQLDELATDYELVAYCFYLKEQYSEVAKYLQKTLEIRPADYQALNNLGNAYTELGKPSEGIEAYKKAVEIKPDMYEAWYNLGNAYKQIDKPSKAIEAYEKAIEIKPDMHDAWYNLGNTYSGLGEPSKAIEAYEKAIEIKPDMHEAWYNLGNAYILLGKAAEAIEAYKKAIEIKPDHYEALNNLGNVYIQLGKSSEAIEAYKKAIEIKPDMREGWYNLGETYSELDKPSEAIEAYKKALETRLDDYQVWHNLGVSYSKLGKTSEALAAFNKSVEVNPDDHRAWHNLGLVHAKLGKTSAAINAFEHALKIVTKRKMQKDMVFVTRNYALILLDKCLDEAFGENYGAAKESLKLALEKLSQIPVDEALELLMSFFTTVLSKDKLGFAAEALGLVKEVGGEELYEGLEPMRTVVQYMKTEDEEIIEKLTPERLKLVKDIIKTVSEQKGTKEKRAKSKRGEQ